MEFAVSNQTIQNGLNGGQPAELQLGRVQCLQRHHRGAQDCCRQSEQCCKAECGLMWPMWLIVQWQGWLLWLLTRMKNADVDKTAADEVTDLGCYALKKRA